MKRRGYCPGGHHFIWDIYPVAMLRVDGGTSPPIYHYQESDSDKCVRSVGLRGSMHDLTGFQRDLLFVVAGLDEPHGLAIKNELEGYYEDEIHHGRLYPNLDTLVEKGLVEKGQKDRRTNIYRLTSRGRRELEARREWENEYLQSVDVVTA